MPLFIVCSLLLGILVQQQSDYLLLLTSVSGLSLSAVMTTACLLGALLKKLETAVWSDGVATGVLLLWYGFWQPQFIDEAPMFFYFPLYFALLTAVLSMTFTQRSEYFDQESIEHLRYIDRNFRLDTSAIVTFVLVSLLIPEHYGLYPVAMTLFIVRYVLTRCLEIVDAP